MISQRLMENKGAVSLVFLGLLLPLVLFAEIAGGVQAQAVFFFDEPTMVFLHTLATPSIDRFFVVISKLGYTWGVVPVNLVVLGVLLFKRKLRLGLFFGLAVLGSIVLNLSAKTYYARVRPEFWQSVAPEATFSFPSGHAMGSATLAAALILLCWPTRGRWWVMGSMIVFTILVGLSRIYLGVHYPSDIMAGWLAGAGWVVILHQILVGHGPRILPAPMERTLPVAGRAS